MSVRSTYCNLGQELNALKRLDNYSALPRVQNDLLFLSLISDEENVLFGNECRGHHWLMHSDPVPASEPLRYRAIYRPSVNPRQRRVIIEPFAPN
jgi:hypothetical protein